MANTPNHVQIVASALVVVLAGVLVYALFPFFKALFGSVILYVLFRSGYIWLNGKLKKPGLSAVIILVASILIILTPLFVVGSLVASEIPDIVTSVRGLGSYNILDRFFPDFDFNPYLQSSVARVGAFLQGAVLSAVGEATHLMISLTIMYVVLYYLLVNTGSHQKKVMALIPFNKKNSKILMDEFTNITYSTVVSTGLIAILQGFLLSIGFLFFGISGAVFWGVIGAVLSFLPVVGVSIVWIPAALFGLFSGNLYAGIGMLIWGVFISNVDNFIRPLIQQRVGKIHPLVSIIGVFIGLSLFGLMGLIIGPLLLSYVFLTIKMYKEEYL